MIKAVIFDMNGVIINDEKAHAEALARALKDYDINLSFQEYKEVGPGRTDLECIAEIARIKGKDLPIEKVFQEKSKYYLEIYPGYKIPAEGIEELLLDLSKKYVLAVASSARRSEVDMVLSEFKITKFFKAIVAAEDVSHGKPDPEPYLLAAQLVGVEPKECVVIEDSVSGVRAAKSAGMGCIGVLTTNSERVLKENGVDAVVKHLREISDLINSIKG